MRRREELLMQRWGSFSSTPTGNAGKRDTIGMDVNDDKSSRGFGRGALKIFLLRLRLVLRQHWKMFLVFLVALGLIHCCGYSFAASTLKGILGSKAYYEKVDYPNFVIIGTWKSGTTSILHYLKLHHPNICMANKEVNFFHTAPRYHSGEWFGKIDSYKKRFQHCLSERDKAKANKESFLIGEKSASYLWAALTPTRISRHLINPKFVVILRHPVERLYSHWYMLWCKKYIDFDFEQFLDRWERPRRTGFYATQLRRWFYRYNREQFLILKSEDFFKNSSQVLERIETFLEVPHYPFSKDQLVVWGSSPKCLQRVGERPPFSAEYRKRLEAYYYRANEDLATLLGPEFDYNRQNKFYNTPSSMVGVFDKEEDLNTQRSTESEVDIAEGEEEETDDRDLQEEEEKEEEGGE